MKKNLKYIHVFLIIAALGFSVKIVLAQEKPTPKLIESWECFEDDLVYSLWSINKEMNQKPPVLARLNRFKQGGSEFGEVVVAGSSQKQDFKSKDLTGDGILELNINTHSSFDRTNRGRITNSLHQASRHRVNFSSVKNDVRGVIITSLLALFTPSFQASTACMCL